METNVNYTIVGAFVILLITCIVLGVIWLSSGFAFQEYSTYKVYMQESVTGLTVDTVVEYNGVDVGSVKSIELNARNPRLVELLLDVKGNTPITRGTVATIDTRGLTGMTYIQLKDKGRDLRPLVRARGEEYPVIRTAPSIFVRLDTALTQLSNSFKKITTSIQGVLDPENTRAIKLTLSNLQQITGTLATNNKRLAAILKNSEEVTHQFIPLLQSSSDTLNVFKYQTLPAVYQIMSNLNMITRNLSSVSVELKQNPSIIIRGTTSVPAGPGESTH